MDQETIRKIAEQLAHYSSYSWTFWVAQGVITLVAAGVGAFFSEYLKTRGKNLATTADFDRLQEQLSANTKLVETVKAEVGQKDWTQREWRNLRRVKLEELLNKVHESEAYENRHAHKNVAGEVVEGERDPASELDSLTTLYFPELEKEVDAYLLLFRNQIHDNAAYNINTSKVRSDRVARDKLFEKFKDERTERARKMIVAKSDLNSAARKLMVQIVGVAG